MLLASIPLMKMFRKNTLQEDIEYYKKKNLQRPPKERCRDKKIHGIYINQSNIWEV
jgi:hypothetical protein